MDRLGYYLLCFFKKLREWGIFYGDRVMDDNFNFNTYA